MPPERRTGPSYMRGGVVACPKRRLATPGFGPPHGRRHRRHLEGGKRTRRVYTEGILLWVWPGCCSKVFLWADLTQPGGEVHW